MQSPTMLYRCPGPETFEGVSCATIIVDEADVAAHLADGWCRNWIEAGAAAKAGAAEKLQANEAEQGKIEQQLKTAGGKARK